MFGPSGYLWPWNSFSLAIALMTWFFPNPGLACMGTFDLGSISLDFARNLSKWGWTAHAHIPILTRCYSDANAFGS